MVLTEENDNLFVRVLLSNRLRYIEQHFDLFQARSLVNLML